MKNRIIKFNSKLLTDALQGRPTSFASNLPNSIELLEVKNDLFSGQIHAVIRSDSFQDLADNQPTPEFKLNFASILKTKSPEPITPERPLTKNDIAQQSQQTSKIEEEFSPEERRLLNFRTDNEQVIIKPTQFLKREWEDINETVRGLGGRWIKSDITSHWVIPMQPS